MQQSAGLQPSFLHDLLVLASRPSTQLDGLLQFILEKALALTASDIGGGIFIFDTSSRQPALVASALRGELANTPANLLITWKQNPRSPALLVAQSGQPYGSDDHQHDPAHFPLLADSRSSLWVPVLKRKKVLGVLHVESSQPRHYQQSHLRDLLGVAAEAVPAIDRLMLREQMVLEGVEMEMIGISTAFLNLERQLKLAAASASRSVLISGERGSGKELAARAIHCWSDRRDKPFVPVLAPALTESLVADELFGHERCAFTGAGKARPGRFLAANGGTLFLDEIGDLPPMVQVTLLRVIECGEIQPLGRDMPVKVDVRVVAATNRDLPELIARGRFRQDLYDRLSVLEIRVPPLRVRREDIRLLVRHFLQRYCHELRRELMPEGTCVTCQNTGSAGCATAEFYERLQTYDWPGNVRELENLIIRLVSTVPGEILDVKHLPEQIEQRSSKAAMAEGEDLALNAIIKNHIERILQMTKYNQSQAARLLGIPFTTLQSKIKKLGIEIKKVRMWGSDA
jgi:two-component system response regulator HydG